MYIGIFRYPRHGCSSLFEQVHLARGFQLLQSESSEFLTFPNVFIDLSN